MWQVKQFENDTIIISPIKKSNADESINPLAENKESLKKGVDEIKVYTEKDHLDKGSEFICELYDKFKLAILNLSDDLEIVPKKYYIAFKKTTNITDIVIQKNSLEIFINKKFRELEDSKKLPKNIINI